MSDTTDVTDYLRSWSDGDKDAIRQVIPKIYSELSRIASQHLRKERNDHTLQTSALVHETYLKISSQQQVRWKNRSHFFAISSRIMRRILVDHARALQREKRGGSAVRLSLDEALTVADDRSADVLALDAALVDLAALDPKLAQVTELRFFAGLENTEIAAVLGTSSRTVIRRWRTARAWLFRYLQGKDAHGQS